MGVANAFVRIAVRATRVLVVEVPGHWSLRVALERQMLNKGWRTARTPAEADVLAVCGTPGEELALLVNRLWDQMPGPRVHVDITVGERVSTALRDAELSLVDTAHHVHDAATRSQTPGLDEGPEESAMSQHGHDHHGMDHGEQGTDQEHHEHAEHGGQDHQSTANGDTGHHGNGGHDHGGMDHDGHGGHDHGGMEMTPAGIALAESGADRDGLEMDVLHLPLGPVLPFWPSGLVLTCSLQGDVVVAADSSVIDRDEEEILVGTGGQSPPGAVLCDHVMMLLALAGADDAAATARITRDAAVSSDWNKAKTSGTRLARKVRRSVLVRWALRGVLPLTVADLERHGLPDHFLGDAYDRLLMLIKQAVDEIDGRDTGAGRPLPLTLLPDLVVGLDVATVRLAIASLAITVLPSVSGSRDE